VRCPRQRRMCSPDGECKLGTAPRRFSVTPPIGLTLSSVLLRRVMLTATDESLDVFDSLRGAEPYCYGRRTAEPPAHVAPAHLSWFSSGAWRGPTTSQTRRTAPSSHPARTRGSGAPPERRCSATCRDRIRDESLHEERPRIRSSDSAPAARRVLLHLPPASPARALLVRVQPGEYFARSTSEQSVPGPT